MAEGTFTNRLAKEKSPYLLQHATNPVDWYPWGEEAFQKARAENKPIFLSIGYSTCHWCHVMEEESFVDPQIAKVLNDHFVSIKVDREERPDVDHIYMQAVMAMTGSGGWPMSLFLTPELKPFYGGTYFPPQDRWGRPGFVAVLNAIHQKWSNDRESLLKSSEDLTQALRAETERRVIEKHELGKETLQKAYEQLESRFESDRGGFSDAPKFPQGHVLSFLLRYWKRTNESQALEMVEKTLTEMAKGGMYDQLGGGFHRYSTDREWRVPHFEKMLYDQAVLSKAYLEAYQATGKSEYAEIAREIFDYVLRDMVDEKGAFYSAEDADSAPDPSKPNEKREGAFYVWPKEEIDTHLGKEKSEIFNDYFGVEVHGNAIHDPQGEFGNKNILYVAHSVEETAEKFSKSKEEIEKLLDESKKMLLKLRSQRPRPHLDDKVLTDWNGLMISSLAFGSRALNEPKYAEAAKKAADFLLSKMKDKDGRLMHRYRDGEVSIPGFLEDYAFFTHGLIDLYEATFDPVYLEEAKFFTEEMIRLFWDEEHSGFFLAGRDSEKLIARSKELYDGATPSGNSIATLSLLRLGRLLVNRDFENRAQKTLESFSKELTQYPSGYSQMMVALDFAIGPSREIVIAGDERDPKVQVFRRTIDSQFLPNQVMIFRPTAGGAQKKIELLSPFTKNQNMLNQQATVYVCKNYVCDLPITETEQLRNLLAH
ncbi:MAG: thioredoxin domain-containing protein [Candidatus Omnitrophica bacterium]|nr:thioredoxin domain-containing protein [Candidatus Omnitrophota bacterium]